jgi:DNA-binding transcriptional regulator PaaX
MRPVTRPNSFIFTLYGDMLHGRGRTGDGSLWIGALIALMSSFGVSAAAVRQAVSRM